jgi:VWFA-related protein
MKNLVLRKNIVVLIFAVIAAPLLLAQTTPKQNPVATFSARTELVLVPAIVTDHQGKHVSGLTKNDFIVQENGVEQKVESFEEITATANRMYRVSTMGKREFSNVHFTDYAPRRINIIVFDLFNTKFTDQAYARQQMVKYLSNSVKSDDLTTLLVLTRGGVRVIHDFTRDPRVLIAAVQKAKHKVGITADANNDVIANADAGMIDQEANDISSLIDQAEARFEAAYQQMAIDVTLDAFESIANAYRGIPGRKSLIWLSGGFPFRMTQPGDITANRFQDRFERFFQKLSDANITVYPVDAAGLVVTALTAADNPRTASGRRIEANTIVTGRNRAVMMTHDTMNSFAEMTGGRAFYNTNDLAGAVERASDDGQSYYVLGYYAKANPQKNGWRTLKVKVKRSGLQVRARAGYFATRSAETDPEQMRKRDIREAADSPFDFTAVPFTVRIADMQPAAEAANKKSAANQPENKKDVAFDILLPPKSLEIDAGDQNHMNFQVIVIPRDAELKTVSGSVDQVVDGHLKPETLDKMNSQGLAYRYHVAIPPGEYSLKFVVRDNISGRIGSVSAPVTVE